MDIPPIVSPKIAHQLVGSQNALLVDVRERDEWAEARIPGAVHIPLGELVARQAEVPRDRPVILQCRSGARSQRATQALVAAGFANVHNLKGGIAEWAADGLPVEYGED